jgi:hypothetical protein
VHLSLGSDGFVGRHRLSIGLGADIYGTNRLRAPSIGTGGGGGADQELASIQLGPVITADVQLQLAAPRLREAVIWVSEAWRAPFSRDGVRVDRSSGNYIDAGFRTSIPTGRRTDVLLAIDGRWQTDLEFDPGIATADAVGGRLTAGLARRMGGLTLQPYARFELGRVGAADDARATFTGGTVGLSLLSRF